MAESFSVVFLLLICLLASVQALSGANTCTEVIDSLNSFGSPSVKDARKCLQSIPYKKSVAAEVINSILKTYRFWPFLDIAKNAPDSRLPSKFDIFVELRKLKGKAFPNAQSFHKAVFDVINSLNDANSIYFPYCFADVWSALPVDFYTYVENGEGVYKIAPFSDYFELYRSTKAVNVTKFWDATVHKVNGVAASVYFLNFVKKSAGKNYKDLGARFNSLFVSEIENTKEYLFGFFSTRYFLTEEDNVTLEVTRKGFSTKETVTLPYFALFPYEYSTFDNSTDYYDKFCQSRMFFSSKKAVTEEKDSKNNLPTENFTERNIFPSRSVRSSDRIGATAVTPPTEKKSSSVSAVSGPTRLFSGRVQSWLLPDKKTGVLIISNFRLDSYEPFNASLKAFVSDVNASCQALLSRKVTHLIIDLQNNVDGSTELPDLVIRYLFPSLKNTSYNYQFRAPLVSQKLVESYNNRTADTRSIFHYRTWANAKNVPFKSPKGFFFPLVSKTLSRTKGNYSSLFTAKSLNIIKPPKNLAPKFSAKNILLLTNGVCATACASFTHKMEEFAKVRIVSVGGLTGVPMAHSGGSGFPYTLESLLSNDLFGEFEDEPTSLPVNAYLGLSVAQSFSPSNSSFPMDYIFKPATYRLPYSKKTVLDKGALWTEVAKFF